MNSLRKTSRLCAVINVNNIQSRKMSFLKDMVNVLETRKSTCETMIRGSWSWCIEINQYDSF